MSPFLAPVEKPHGLMLKLAYFFTRKQFGKTITPLKVMAARLPTGFGMFYPKVEQLNKQLELPLETQLLFRHRVAVLTQCPFALDSHRWALVKWSVKEEKFEALESYRTNPLFSEAERAALDYITELTENRKVKPESFQRLAQHYSERQICEIVWIVSTELFLNITNLGLNVPSDGLYDLIRQKN